MRQAAGGDAGGAVVVVTGGHVNGRGAGIARAGGFCRHLFVARVGNGMVGVGGHRADGQNLAHAGWNAGQDDDRPGGRVDMSAIAAPMGVA